MIRVAMLKRGTITKVTRVTGATGVLRTGVARGPEEMRIFDMDRRIAVEIATEKRM